jgi:hypothetical protein
MPSVETVPIVVETLRREGPAGAWRGPEVPPGAWREGVIKSKRPLCKICREREVPASRGHSKTCSDECGKELERRRDNKPSRKKRRREIYVPHPSEPVEKKCVDCGDKFFSMPRGNSQRCTDCRRKRRNKQQNASYAANIEDERKYQRDRRAANPKKARTRARGYYRLDAEKIRPAQNARRKAKRKPRKLWCKYCQSYFDHWKPGTEPEACPKPECQEAKLAARAAADVIRLREFNRKRPKKPRAPAKQPWLAEGVSKTTWYRRKGKPANGPKTCRWWTAVADGAPIKEHRCPSPKGQFQPKRNWKSAKFCSAQCKSAHHYVKRKK